MGLRTNPGAERIVVHSQINLLALRDEFRSDGNSFVVADGTEQEGGASRLGRAASDPKKKSEHSQQNTTRHQIFHRVSAWTARDCSVPKKDSWPESLFGMAVHGYPCKSGTSHLTLV